MEEGFVGEIRLFAGTFARKGWAFCDGSVLPLTAILELFEVIGTQFGGDGINTFALPKIGPLATAGPGATPIQYIICTYGTFPQRP